jgi:hypothetical protein
LTTFAGLVLFRLGKLELAKQAIPANSQTVQAGASPRTVGPVSVEEALAKRRSIRKYAGEPLTHVERDSELSEASLPPKSKYALSPVLISRDWI